jgi:serine/threonine protein kinase
MHRDLKPENIMLRGDSLDPVIVDFGLSTNSDLKEYLFFRCGTPGYVAPEIIQLIQCSHVEPVCDIFSLGAIFHIMLVKKPLFEGTKYDEVYKNNKEFRFKIDGDSYKHAEPAAVDLLREMLHLVPEKRICSRRALDHSYIKLVEADM